MEEFLPFPDYFTNSFKKITPINGFDSTNLDNARQNSYAWSMAEMDDYLYVGTSRNIVYSVLASGLLGDITPPPEFTPKQLDMAGEIWRYKKDGSSQWERVYKAPPGSGIVGFRFMLPYTTPLGERALYAGCAVAGGNNVVILKSTDGQNWKPLRSGVAIGGSTRAMTVHQGRLYMTVLPGDETLVTETRLYVSTDPEKNDWQPVNLAGNNAKNPLGNGMILFSYNDHLYLGTALPGGFELWRTRGTLPETDNWKLVVDKGAGDGLNEVPLSVGFYKDYIYLGTALYFGFYSLNPEKRFVPPKGFDVIRINRNDEWELVIGGPPVLPTEPTTGRRGLPLSGLPSGFGNIFNGYCWQIQVQNNELYLGTFDWSVLIPPIAPLLIQFLKKRTRYNLDNYLANLTGFLRNISFSDPVLTRLAEERVWEGILEYLGRKTFGFDLWRSRDGIRWSPVSINGLGNPENYGARNLFLSSSGDLYLGTANPFNGCEVWVKKANKKPWLR
ncbi:MAG TPA: hypothetical protein GXX38_01800 [Clostridia bacterium]|nr:hypothetical protein [Clostridia bacterium]